ncbi:MAG TPA: acetyl-CoA carboxylase biotin carboxyl carrier protein [Geminicoccaceae bacterium]|nr:acetyl-CoA carboxylase biotin carboxyl carrier protein [Geminicoccus sp.]HMU49438.1 acetyl-CoA carboxylase biotin carboxyl carrier protein [Geminicoccaceae bacterium]
MSKLDIDTDYIEKLADIIGRTGLTEIEISHGDTRIRVARQVQMVVEASMPRAHGPLPADSPAATSGPAGKAEASPDLASHPGTLASPMVGTAYLLPEPGAAPFVEVGDEVREGQTLLIIEAMKVMNAIRSPRSGRVTRIMVQNAAPVEYGEPLMVIE